MRFSEDYLQKKEDRFRKILIYLFCIIAIFQAGLRDPYNLPDGNDTLTYQVIYNQLMSTSWESFFKDYSLFSSDYSGRDSGYAFFLKLSQYISKDFTFYMFLTAIIFMIPFSMLVYKYVKSYLGIILVFAIYFAIFTGIINSFMRQAAALGITLFATKYIISRKWVCYYGLMLIALTFHGSAIAAFPFYFIPRISRTEKWLKLSFVAFPVMILFLKPLMKYFVSGTVYDGYLTEEIVNPVNYMALIVAISMLALIFFKDIRQLKDGEILISSAIGTMLFLPVVFMGNTVLRLSYYYVLILILLLPNVVDSMKISRMSKILTYLFLISFFVFMIFRT